MDQCADKTPWPRHCKQHYRQRLVLLSRRECIIHHEASRACFQFSTPPDVAMSRGFLVLHNFTYRGLLMSP